jgi:hypothetical protein
MSIVHLHIAPCPHCSRYWWARISLAMLGGLDADTLHHAMLETLAMTPATESC